MGIARGPSWRPTSVLTLLLVCTSLFASAGCGGSDADFGTGCGVPGYTRECFENCDYGTQVCRLDGQWGACLCSGGKPSSAAGTTAGLSAGTTAGNGGAGSGAGNGGAGSGASTDAGLDADVDANAIADASTMDSGAMEPALYTRCTKAADCDNGASCHRSSVSGGGATGNSGFCTIKCTQPADCPAPQSGTSTVTCNSSSVCQPKCGIGITCPNGLVCVNLGPSGTCI